MRGGQDDMSSQGSYMIRRGTEFNQSEKSIMIRAGQSQMDDMSSQGSYMIRANNFDETS